MCVDCSRPPRPARGCSPTSSSANGAGREAAMVGPPTVLQDRRGILRLPLSRHRLRLCSRVAASLKVDWVTYNADGIAPAMRVVDLIDHLRRLISQLERYEGPAT